MKREMNEMMKMQEAARDRLCGTLSGYMLGLFSFLAMCWPLRRVGLIEAGILIDMFAFPLLGACCGYLIVAWLQRKEGGRDEPGSLRDQ